MNCIADNLSQWAHTALQIEQFPKPQMVDNNIVDVINMVKVDMERIKANQSMGKGNALSGGVGSGALRGFGVTPPSADGEAESPGQWIAQLTASGANGDGGGSEGDPQDSNGMVHGGGSRGDKR